MVLELVGRFAAVKASVTLGETKPATRTVRGQDRRCRIITRALAQETIRDATGNVQSLRIVYRSIQIRLSFVALLTFYVSGWHITYVTILRHSIVTEQMSQLHMIGPTKPVEVNRIGS
jgi:hypothetical protein